MSSYSHINGFGSSPPRPQSSTRNRRRTLDPSFMAPPVLGPDEKPSRGSSAARDDYTSDSGRSSHAKQPVNEAINSAFTVPDGTAAASSAAAAAAALSPEILAQITSHVIQQLRSTDLHAASESLPPQPQKYQARPQASTTDLPEPARTARKESVSDAPLSPPLGRATARTPPSPADKASNPAVESDKEERGSGPKGPPGISNDPGITIVERVWGDLFTQQGESTPRLGQFLRGIALHLISDYEPKHSLVITPEKMQRYYEETKVDNEIYPWRVIFDDRTSRISRMFREMSAQHHLVQHPGQEQDRPDLPGLTHQGFATWATLLIKAHPSLEFERLAKTAREMPISNPDDPKERFPKELSRRLFPEHSDESIAAKLQQAISLHCNLSLSTRQDNAEEIRSNTSTSNDNANATNTNAANANAANANAANVANPKRGSISASEPGQPSIPPVLSNESASQPTERLSKVISHTDSGVIVDDNTPTAIPIERKRKPYVAAPGGGKSYDDQTLSGAESKPPIPTEPRASSALSGAGRSDPAKLRPTPLSIHSPKPGPPTPVDNTEARRRRSSAIFRDPPTMAAPAPAPAPRRVRSPSVGRSNGYGRRSESDYAYGTSYPSAASVDKDNGDSSRRYRDYESIRETTGERYDTPTASSRTAAAFEGRDHRERLHSRARGHSISSTPRAVYIPDDDYHKAYSGYPSHSSLSSSSVPYIPASTPVSAVYPPNAFRESRPDGSDPGVVVSSGRRSTKDTDGFGDYARNPPR